MIKFTEHSSLVVKYVDGLNSKEVLLPYHKIKHLILDEATEILVTPNCQESTCAVNNFCECDPINEEMEFQGLYLKVNSAESNSRKKIMITNEIAASIDKEIEEKQQRAKQIRDRHNNN